MYNIKDIEHKVEKIRIKTGEFLARYTRQDIERGLTKPGEHRFYRLEMPFKDALAKLPMLREKLQTSPVYEYLKIRNLNLETDLYHFHQLYNAIFLTSPDPTRSITPEEARGFPEDRTFLVILYNSPVGFIYLTIEKDPVDPDNPYPVGAVAGVGVLAKHRGKKIGLALLKTAIEYFEDKGVNKLICEVYEQNEASLRMFKGFGMKIVGIMILEEEQPM